MRIIQICADNWLTPLDFYEALLAALNAPEWHGKNINALVESMIWDDRINALEPPYTILIGGIEKVSGNIREEIELLKGALEQARDQYRATRGSDVEVQLETSCIT